MQEKMNWSDKHVIARLRVLLQENMLLVGSSDTVVGLLAPLCQHGFDKLNEIKGRANKPYLILIGSIEKAKKFTNQLNSLQVEKIVRQCWPGPLTIIVKAKKNLPDFLTLRGDTVALRMPKHDGLLQLLAHVDGLFSTSANLAGEPVAKTIAEINPKIRAQVAAVIDDAKAGEAKTVPSTILDLSGEVIKIIREGAYSQAELERILGQTIAVAQSDR